MTKLVVCVPKLTFVCTLPIKDHLKLVPYCNLLVANLITGLGNPINNIAMKKELKIAINC